MTGEMRVVTPHLAHHSSTKHSATPREAMRQSVLPILFDAQRDHHGPAPRISDAR